MKKYLDIILFTLLFFFLFSYFSGQNNQTPSSGILFTLDKGAYKVPAGITSIITNNTDNELIFNTCENISIRYEGEIIALPEDMCSDIKLSVRDEYRFDLSAEYELFTSPGDYVFSFNYEEKEYVESTEIKFRGTIGKIFV